VKRLESLEKSEEKLVPQIEMCKQSLLGHSMSNHPKKDNSKPYPFRI